MEKNYINKTGFLSFICFILIFIDMIVVFFLFFIYDIRISKNIIDFISHGSIIVFFSFLIPYIWVVDWGKYYATLVSVSDDCFSAFILGIKLCEVNKKRPIYYEIVEITYQREQYVIISNKPFDLNIDADFSKLFSWKLKYDMKNQIMLPYNKKTKKYLFSSNWIRNKTVTTSVS